MKVLGIYREEDIFLLKEDKNDSKVIRREAFVDHFTRTREWEIKQFAQSVTDWEYKRYFEII